MKEVKNEKRGKVVQGLNIPIVLAKKFKHKCVDEELSPRDVVGVLTKKFCDGEFDGVVFGAEMREIEGKYWGE